jgi:two-component system, NtrC family, sensor histidine kinase HydH
VLDPVPNPASLGTQPQEPSAGGESAPEQAEGQARAGATRTFSLNRRFAWATAARLILLSVLLFVTLSVNVRGKLTLASFTVQVATLTLLVAFGLSALYAWFLRQGKHLRLLVTVQLVLDQAIWTVVVYLSGGATSGATSLYGISCIFGAILSGFKGAALAAMAAAGYYLLLVFGMQYGWVRPPPDQPSVVYLLSGDEAIYGAVVNLLVLIVVALLSGNLTERLRATGGQLARAEARADRAEREAELGRLAAALAHEIRNPLGSISGSIRMLRTNPGLDEDDQQLCDIVDREASRLNDLVSDMLNLAKTRKPELQIVDLSQVAREVVDLAAHSGRGFQDVPIVFIGLPELRVSADSAMLRQLLWNLVRNAVQASTAGSAVRVASRIEDGRAEIQVVDHGEGLDPTAKGKLFDPFYTTRSKGTGIGLAVVRRIVDDHGWTIQVLDTEGGGATFQVVLGPPQDGPVGSHHPKKPERWTLSPDAG